MKNTMILIALFVSGLSVTTGCESAAPRKPEPSILEAQQSAVSDPKAASTATFQAAAKETIDWNGVIAKLAKDNIFRIVYAAQSKAKNRGDDGMATLSKDDQVRYSQYQTDMREVYAIFARSKGSDLSSADKDRVATLQKPYAYARQELYTALMGRPDLSTDGRAAFNRAIAQINNTRQMQLTTTP